MNSPNKQKGFIAFITVLMIVSAIINFSFVVLSSAYLYADSVYRKGIRIQANYNLDSCTIYSKYLYAQNYFLIGDIEIEQFDCSLKISNDFGGNVMIFATSTIGNISLARKISLHNDGYVVKEN